MTYDGWLFTLLAINTFEFVKKLVLSETRPRVQESGTHHPSPQIFGECLVLGTSKTISSLVSNPIKFSKSFLMIQPL